MTEAATPDRWQSVVDTLDEMVSRSVRGPRHELKRPALRFDYSAIVFQLEAAGMSQREIGGQCEADQTWVQRLKNVPGTQPKLHNGLLLLGLWMSTTGRPATDIPTC